MNMHGVQRIIYENWSCEVFEGFYSTIIGDLSSVYEMEPTPPEGYEYDVRDWKGYQNKVGKYFTSLLEDQLGNCSSEILSNLEFKGIDSPREYNFTTDKAEIEMDVDTDALRDYCFKTNRTKFDGYLHENFTTRDGFWSFIKNNVHDFEGTLEMDEEFDRYIRVMIEFYLLEEVDFEDLREDLYEEITEIKCEHVCQYNWEDSCRYDYTVNCDNPDGEIVIVGEKIND